METQATITGHAEAGRGQVPVWLPMLVYVILLSIVSEALAFTAYGLIARWGEMFPRWIPGLRGRRVPPLAAVIPAAFGACILTALWTETAVMAVLGRDIQGRPMQADSFLNPHRWQGWLVIVCYAPLLLWGPLLGALTVAYWWRRKRTPAGSVTPQSAHLASTPPTIDHDGDGSPWPRDDSIAWCAPSTTDSYPLAK